MCTNTKNKENIKAMFNDIAPKYDLLNHLLSAGIDRRWRKKIRKILKQKKSKKILDVATGTADLAIEIAKIKPQKIIGIDIADKMIEIGNKKIQKEKLQQTITLKIGDSLNIKYPENSFDAVTCAFGVRNFQNINKGLKQMHKVLAKNGTLIILEFAKPKNKLFKKIYNTYFHSILPFIGKKISNNKKAYKYLPNSVETFPYGKKFTQILSETGFKNTQYKKLTLGIANLYTAQK